MSFIAAKTLLTTKRVELISKKEFAKVALDENFETFVVHIVFLNLTPGLHPNRAAQIASLLTKKVKILEEYLDFVNVFSEEKTLVLPECIRLNKYTIKLKDGKQPPYWLIYNLDTLKLKTLKIYTKTHLKTGFIWLFKSLAGALILFDKKLDGSLRLYVDYQALNNLIIKNRYSLPLIRKLLDQLGQAKRFIHLDLTSAYHQWGSRKLTSGKRLFELDTIASSIRWCYSDYLMP